MSEPELNLNLPDEAPLKKELGPALRELEQSGVWIGTSSWKYQGWIGRLYSGSRYARKGKVVEARFNAECLTEFSETFHTVCVDSAFYHYPTEEQIDALAAQVPPVFKFAFKVTDHITIPVWPHQQRFGAEAGRPPGEPRRKGTSFVGRREKEAGNPNPHFLSAESFRRRFLAPVERLGDRLGVMIFEFSPIQKNIIGSSREFAERLGVFLQQLPKGHRYAVEIRNKEFLCPEYLRALRENGVAHCFNSWTRMPPVSEQLKMPDILTTNFIVARFLLKPGRTFQQAVDAFKPYDRIREIYEEGRGVARELIRLARKRGLGAMLFFGNRFEGNSPETIRSVIRGEKPD